jgi:hypothetical protein
MNHECGGRLTIEQRGMLVHSLRLVASQLDSDGAEACEYRVEFPADSARSATPRGQAYGRRVGTGRPTTGTIGRARRR